MTENAPPAEAISPRTKRWRGTWMVVASLAIVLVMIWLLWTPRRPTAATGGSKPAVEKPEEAVRVAGPGLIAVSADTPLHKEMSVQELVEQSVTFPRLTVAGVILARVRPGAEPLEDRWQFSNSDLSSNYSEWLRTKSEIGFAESQLTKTRELVEAQTSYLEANVKRLEPLLLKASIPEKDFKLAKSELLKAQLQGEKDIFTAQSTLRTAQKNRAGLERSLAQAGIDPAVFGRAEENMVLIAANVPETKVSQVESDQSCQVRFYGYPDRLFHGHVESLGTTLTQDRRTLRVLFHLEDAEGLLKPGMFAEAGLGTDEREAMLVPAESLLHIDRKDYVLIEAAEGLWHVAPVEVGEIHDGKYEIFTGLTAGQKILSSGTILLKPTVALALAAETSAAKTARGGERAP